MNVEILDNEVFSALNPLDIEKYLKRNWHEIKRTPNEVSIWETVTAEEKKIRVWLPLDKSFEDYEENLGRLVKKVSLAENRSQLEVFEDLDTIGTGDVIRLYTYDEFNRTSTSLPIKDGIAFIEKAKNIAVAAALATESKRPVFPSRRSVEVMSYINNVRLGQTEKGSYKIKIISPLSQPNLPSINRVPFERKVVVNLIKSLDALQKVSSEMQKKGRFHFEAYQELVNEGVSANLCEALVNSNNQSNIMPIEVSVSWSYIIEAPDINIQQVRFDKGLLLYVEKAATEFREKNPQEVSIQGYVSTLHRLPKKKKEPPKITVFGLVEDRPRNVHIILEKDYYDMAIDAHKEEKQVEVEGTLKKEKNYFTLDNITKFRIVD